MIDVDDVEDHQAAVAVQVVEAVAFEPVEVGLLDRARSPRRAGRLGGRSDVSRAVSSSGRQATSGAGAPEIGRLLTVSEARTRRLRREVGLIENAIGTVDAVAARATSTAHDAAATSTLKAARFWTACFVMSSFSHAFDSLLIVGTGTGPFPPGIPRVAATIDSKSTNLTQMRLCRFSR